MITLSHEMNSSVQIDRTTLPVKESQFIMNSIIPTQCLPDFHWIFLLHNLNISYTALKGVFNYLSNSGNNVIVIFDTALNIKGLNKGNNTRNISLSFGALWVIIYVVQYKLIYTHKMMYMKTVLNTDDKRINSQQNNKHH